VTAPCCGHLCQIDSRRSSQAGCVGRASFFAPCPALPSFPAVERIGAKIAVDADPQRASGDNHSDVLEELCSPVAFSGEPKSHCFL